LALAVRLGRSVSGGAESPVKTVEEYRKQAAECRNLGRRVVARDIREQLERMAEHWEALAVQRERSLRLQGIVPSPGSKP
jgi:chromosome segregation ATPase